MRRRRGMYRLEGRNRCCDRQRREGVADRVHSTMNDDIRNCEFNDWFDLPVLHRSRSIASLTGDGLDLVLPAVVVTAVKHTV